MLRRGALGLAVVVGDVRPANDVAADSLAATLGCARSMAAELLAGRRRWTEHQRAKLARRAG